MKKYLLVAISILIIGNCFGQAPSWAWANSAGGTTDDEGYSIAVDAAGNSYVTGYFQSTSITFGSDTLTSSGVYFGDIFVVKYDAGGNVVWSKSPGGSSGGRGKSIAEDAGGNSYVTGYFGNTSIIFGSDTLTSVASIDMFIVKYDASGNVVWAKSAGGSFQDYGYGIAVDAVGNSYVTGIFISPSIIFGSDTLINASGNAWNMFIVKYDASGNVVWAKSAGGNSGDAGTCIGVDGGGNSYVTGYFKSPSITFGSTTLTNAVNTGNSADMFIVKYDVSGNVVWAKSPAGSADEMGSGIAVDVGGNSYVTGEFHSPSIIFGSTTLTNTNIPSVFIVKYDANGNVVWAKSPSGSSSSRGYGIAVDAGGNSYVTGSFGAAGIIFGSTTLINTNTGSVDMFIIKYDSGGNVMWAKSIGGNSDEIGNSIDVDAGGKCYVTGYFGSPSITLGSTTLTNTAGIGSLDMLIAKLSSSTVGISESEQANVFSIYPNPFTSLTTITFNEEHASTNSAPHTIIITDVLGNIINQSTINSKQYTIDMSDYAKGIYFVRIVSAGSTTNVVNRKIIKN